MRMNDPPHGAVSSTEYKTEKTCDLFSDEHTIPGAVAQVLDALDSKHDTLGVVAGGCGGCTVVDRPMGVFYVAQDPTHSDYVMLKYDVDDDAEMTRHELGQEIVETAESMGVDWSWDGSTIKCVAVGTDDAYDENITLD